MEETARPVDFVLDEMKIIRVKVRREKLILRNTLSTEIDDHVVPKSVDKHKGRCRTLHKRPAVKCKFLNDAKIPSILTMENYRKNQIDKIPKQPEVSELPSTSSFHGNFLDESNRSGRILNYEAVRI